MRNWIKLFLTVSIIACTIVSCSTDDNPTEPTQMDLNGCIQKGPFISGTTLTIQELTDSFVSNGTTYSTTINNDFGGFALSSEISTNYIEVIANGYYFDEVAGQLSSSVLTLRSVVNVNESGSTNVNILTTLSKDRIIHLVIEEDLNFEDAKSQAENEILQIFGITETDIDNFNDMDISENSISNAILLAVSATLQGNNTVSELSELISKINLDIKEDGILNDQMCIDEIRNNGKYLVFTEVRNNIEERYSNLGISVNIPFFEDYLDSDGDGIINKNDDDTYLWIQTSSSVEFSIYRGIDNFVTINNKIWFLGENEIWNSDDGLNWINVSNQTPWSYRNNEIFFYNDKVYVISVGNSKIWSTSDGLNYSLETDSSASCLNNSQVHCEVFNNEIICISSENSGTTSIWSSGDCINWNEVTSSIPWAPLIDYSTVISGNNLFVIGGYDFDEATFKEAWKSPDILNWNRITDLPDQYIYDSVDAISFNNKIMILTPLLFCSSIDGNEWVIESQNRSGVNALFIFDSKIFGIGNNGIWNYMNYLDWSLM